MASETAGRKALDVVSQVIASVGRVPDSIDMSASWADERDWTAGLTASSEEITVFYGPAIAEVESPEDAARLLKGIFRDEIVCVTALEKDMPVHHALARHDDLTASFNKLDRPSARNMPDIDHVQVRSWSGKRDQE